jgi:hypothetical protein
MTSQSLRIYTYKITFEEVPYYYYGVHKEKRFDEEYWGTPITNKWCWELYTLKKQIVQLFDFTDEGWLEAQEVETRLIKPFYNTDKWCLNENCGGVISLKILREIGKETYRQKIGLHKLSTEERIEIGKKVGRKSYELGRGIFGITPEERKQINQRMYDSKIGIFGISKEERIEIGKRCGDISGKKNYENGIGLASITKEERKEIVARTNSQKWMCLETGYTTTSGPLTRYQRARGIDTSKSNRIRLS